MVLVFWMVFLGAGKAQLFGFTIQLMCFPLQLYYENYVGLTPLQTVLGVLPMTISGLTCNVFIGLFISYIPIVYLTGTRVCPNLAVFSI